MLNEEPEVEVIGQEGEPHNFLEEIKRSKPDVAVLDLSLPSLAGLSLADEIKTKKMPIQVVFLTNLDQEEYLREAFNAGALGYVLKSDTPKDLLVAIRKACRGFRYVSKSLPWGSNQEVQSTYPKQKKKELTPREKEVLKLIAGGFTNQEIAGKLSLSVKTVETHRANIIKKLEARTTAELTLYAVRLGLITP